jgi:hypothetical protein
MAWTTPQHVTSGEASSVQFNAETVDNLLYLKATVDSLPRGVVGTPVLITSAAQVLTTSPVDLAGVAITFTAEAGRRYEITAHAMFDGRFAPGYYVAGITRGSTGLVWGHLIGATGGGNTFADLSVHDAPGAGSVTYKMRAMTDTGGAGAIWTAGNASSSLGVSGPTSFIVKDIGPS